MNKSKFFLIILIFYVLLILPAQAQTYIESKKTFNKGELMVSVTSLEITDKNLYMSYEIQNNSEEDVWVYTGMYQSPVTPFSMSAAALVTEDGQTLKIWSRLKSPSITAPTVYPNSPDFARYVRLRPGQIKTESIVMEIPVYPFPRFGYVSEQEQDTQYATKLALELGYFAGNIPDKLLRICVKNEKKRPVDSSNSVLPFFSPGINENLISRDDELLIMLVDTIPLVEKVSEVVVDNVRIPYQEKLNLEVTYERPNFTSCTNIEIEYQPSILEYFFPFDFQQSLLSPEELEYLRSEKTIFIQDIQNIKEIADDISMTCTGIIHGGLLVQRYRSSANFLCHFNNKPTKSFSIYNDNTIRIDGNLIPCTRVFPTLKTVTPRIQAIDLRMRCAANLKNQWYRFQYYHFHEALRKKNSTLRNKMIYPTATKWCDDMRRIYPVFRSTILGYDKHICLSAGEGKNHYAMNPNCEPNSPGDMVLLFETKGGWNQHGGPELFTFDNHDPKGGCVLLNDGTVKFIRTQEELNALKWK